MSNRMAEISIVVMNLITLIPNTTCDVAHIPTNIKKVSSICSQVPHVPNKGLHVNWHGVRLPDNCRVQFNGDTEVCASIYHYTVTDCNFQMEMRQGNNKLLTVMSCNENVNGTIDEHWKQCTEVGQPLVFNFPNSTVTGKNAFEFVVKSTTTSNGTAPTPQLWMTFIFAMVAVLLPILRLFAPHIQL